MGPHVDFVFTKKREGICYFTKNERGAPTCTQARPHAHTKTHTYTHMRACACVICLWH